jgi:hypothetical protein
MPSESQNIQKHGKLDPLIGFHSIWVKIASCPGGMPKICENSRKFVRFSLKPGNLPAIPHWEEVLAGCTETVIGGGE